MKLGLSACVVGLVLYLGANTLPNVANSEEASFSRANTLLFFTDHLANVSVPNTIQYTFVNTSSETDEFSDTIEVQVTSAPRGADKEVTLNYFTGERRRYVPPISNPQGNPVLKVFLQRDVHEMARLTSGPWRHFQNRIKWAFANDALISPVTFDLNGTEVHGSRVRIEPYRNDPKRGRFKKYANKYYEFTVSEDVPGMVHKIRSVVPGSGQTTETPGAGPLSEAVLTFRSVIK